MNRRAQVGSVTVELVLLTPVLLAMVLLVASVGRGAHAAATVQLAADHAARAASMVRRSSMVATAHDTVRATLQGRAYGCDDPHVAVAAAFDRVTVDVMCHLDGRAVRASSSEIIDVYRGEP